MAVTPTGGEEQVPRALADAGTPAIAPPRVTGGAERVPHARPSSSSRPAGVVSARGRRRGVLWLIAFAALVLGLAVAMARGSGTVVPTGRPAPVFALPDLGGHLVSSLRLRGAGNPVLVLAFQSVACTICDPLWPDLAVWGHAAGAQVRIVAVEVGQPVSVVEMDLNGRRLPVPVLVDPSGGVALAYGVTALPTFAFINRHGDLVSVDAVVSRTGLWPAATWWHYLRQAEAP